MHLSRFVLQMGTTYRAPPHLFLTAMRTLIVFFVLLVSLPAADVAFGQDGSSYFHRGAQLYIDGAIAEAQTVVGEGLRVRPDDPKLQALKEKLEQQQQQQSQQSQQEQQSEQEQNENASDSQDQQDGSEEQSENTEQGQQQQEEEQSGSEEGEQQEQQEGDQQQPDPSQAEPVRNPEEISEEQAMRILQALENQELQLLREARKPPSDARRVEKDW